MAKLKADVAPQPVTSSYTFPDLSAVIPLVAMGAFAEDPFVKITWGVDATSPIRVDAWGFDCHAVGVCMPIRIPPGKMQS